MMPKMARALGVKTLPKAPSWQDGLNGGHRKILAQTLLTGYEEETDSCKWLKRFRYLRHYV